MSTSTPEILDAHHPQLLGDIRSLFEDYWNSFGFTPCFQGFSEELANLPGPYAPPGGALLLARLGGVPAGCVALRRMDDSRCEAKRLYVKPAFRGAGIGRALLEAAIARARASGYREVLGDTMPVMAEALNMYERMGFEKTSPYLTEPTPGAICIRLKLGD